MGGSNEKQTVDAMIEDQEGSSQSDALEASESYTYIMADNYHPATYTFGTIDCLAIAINVVSVVYFPRLSRVLTSEIVILMFTLLALSLVSLSLFVIKLFDLVQNAIKENLHLMTMFAPVCYHIIVPAILMKAASFFNKAYQNGMNTYLYSGVCVFSIFHVVMIISPGHEAFDYRKAGTQHTSHEGLHMSMSTPLLLLVGAVPQFLGTVLMLRISYHISRAAKLRRAQLEGELEASEAKQTTHAMNSMSVSVSHLPGGTQSSHYHQNSHSNSGYNNGGHHVDFAFGVDFYIKQLARNYFTRWTWMTAVLVFPSFFISTLSFCLFLRGAKTPHYFGYFQATCDSLIFFTQPVNLTILWVSLVMKHLPPSENKRGNKTPMGGDTISATAALNFSGASGGGQLSRATSIKYLPLSTSMPATTAGVFINSIPHGAMVQTHGGVAHGIVYPTPPPESQFQSAGKFGVVGTSSLPQQGVYVTENGEEAIRLYQLEHQSRPQSMLSGAIMEASI